MSSFRRAHLDEHFAFAGGGEGHLLQLQTLVLLLDECFMCVGHAGLESEVRTRREESERERWSRSRDDLTQLGRMLT